MTNDKLRKKQSGLTEKQAKDLLAEHGPNKLPESPPPSDLQILIAQIKNPLVYVLGIAGLVTLALGEIPDTIIIYFAVLINTALSFVQERRASRALEALKKLLHPKANAIRDGKEKEIEVEDIVPGDLVVLGQGDKIPADGVLVESNRFFVDEAVLTGESIPVEKHATTKKFEIRNSKFEIPQASLVSMGTVVNAGRAKMMVLKTGKHTKMGSIAKSVQEADRPTPLKRQLSIFSKQITYLVLGLVGFVFTIGYLKGVELVSLFETSVALAVSSIPEGMLVGLTVVLAIGMQRILKRRGLVRHLISAETLGGVTTICVDKTGTLTVGKMQVVDFVGDEQKLTTQIVLANDHDDPIVIAGFDWAIKRIGNWKLEIGKLTRDNPRLDSMPFSSEKRYFASLHKGYSESSDQVTHSSRAEHTTGQAKRTSNTIYVNGAPDLLMKKANLTKSESVKLQKLTNKL